eukprot:Opistho-2@31541
MPSCIRGRILSCVRLHSDCHANIGCVSPDCSRLPLASSGMAIAFSPRKYQTLPSSLSTATVSQATAHFPWVPCAEVARTLPSQLFRPPCERAFSRCGAVAFRSACVRYYELPHQRGHAGDAWLISELHSHSWEI